MWRDAAIVGLVVLGLACGFVWLVLWADERATSGLYQANEAAGLGTAGRANGA